MEAEDNARREMHLPYWERSEYRTKITSCKQIKSVQQKLDTPMQDYIRHKIAEQEKRLVVSALQMKKNLKANDELWHNGMTKPA